MQIIKPSMFTWNCREYDDIYFMSRTLEESRLRFRAFLVLELDRAITNAHTHWSKVMNKGFEISPIDFIEED